jgi:hypothetical protein
MEEQITELRKHIIILQQHLARAITLAEESILPLIPQIDRWRAAIDWQPSAQANADDEHDPTIGIRL